MPASAHVRTHSSTPPEPATPPAPAEPAAPPAPAEPAAPPAPQYATSRSGSISLQTGMYSWPISEKTQVQCITLPPSTQVPSCAPEQGKPGCGNPGGGHDP